MGIRRFYTVLLICLVGYIALSSLYLLKGDLFPLPAGVQGTAADPHTFMTDQQIGKAESLSRLRSLTFFLLPPLKVGLLLLLLGVSVRFRDFVKSRFRKAWLQMIAYVFLFMLLLGVLFLPIDYALLRLEQSYGQSNETLSVFLSDHGKSFIIEWIGTIVMVWIFYWVLKRSPQRWWLWFWMISIPLILFVQFVQPVVLDPLFNNFQPLQNQELKRDILALAAKSGIPADQVYEVNMSERTNAINAYVNGIGSNARIVLWDTTLAKMKTDEILTVMAHEMGHYVERHIYWGIAYGIVLGFFGFWLAYHAFRYFLSRWGHYWNLRGSQDLAALPVLLLLITLMNFVSAPIQNGFSRILEHRADMYAMKMTGDGDAAIRAFRLITKENLSPVTQPKLIKWFCGSHPTTLERIQYFEHFRVSGK